MTIGLQLCRWYYQEIGAWKWVSADFVFFHQFFPLFLTYSLSKTLKKWMTLNKVLLVRVIHMTKQFWDKIGRFDADKYAENVLKLECYKSVHAVIYGSALWWKWDYACSIEWGEVQVRKRYTFLDSFLLSQLYLLITFDNSSRSRENRINPNPQVSPFYSSSSFPSTSHPLTFFSAIISEK